MSRKKTVAKSCTPVDKDRRVFESFLVAHDFVGEFLYPPSRRREEERREIVADPDKDIGRHHDHPFDAHSPSAIGENASHRARRANIEKRIPRRAYHDRRSAVTRRKAACPVLHERWRIEAIHRIADNKERSLLFSTERFAGYLDARHRMTAVRQFLADAGGEPRGIPRAGKKTNGDHPIPVRCR